MTIELDTKYRPGTRTLIYLFIRGCWWLLFPGIGLGYVAYKMFFGSWHEAVAQYLAQHQSWAIDVPMLSEWLLLGAFSLILVAFLRASVLYRWYSFHLGEHAMHLRRGMISVQEITIPYQQITNIHIEQPYHWRLFGLAQLDVTISSSPSLINVRKKREFLIPCLDTSLARALSHFLTKQTAGETDDEDDDEEFEEEDGEDVVIGKAQRFDV